MLIDVIWSASWEVSQHRTGLNYSQATLFFFWLHYTIDITVKFGIDSVTVHANTIKSRCHCSTIKASENFETKNFAKVKPNLGYVLTFLGWALWALIALVFLCTYIRFVCPPVQLVWKCVAPMCISFPLRNCCEWHKVSRLSCDHKSSACTLYNVHFGEQVLLCYWTRALTTPNIWI